MDTYRAKDFKREVYPGVFNSKEEDNDLLAHHNQEMIQKGLDPYSGKAFNVYLCKAAADRGDPEAKRAYHELVYEFMSASVHPKLNSLVVNSYNRIAEQRRKILYRDFRTRRI